MKVLIVEDDLVTRRLLSRVLAERGHEVVECATAEDAKRACAETFFPWIVLDILLPGMDGLSFCRWFRSTPKGDYSYILVGTVCGQVKDLEAVLAAGADDYIAKPFEPNLLRVRLTVAEQQIQRILARKQAEEDKQAIEGKMQETQKYESLGVLTGGIAHEFNNVLTSILGNASLARISLPAINKEHLYLEQIERASLRAAEICKQMLAYAGKGQITVQRANLTTIIDETSQFLKLSIGKKAQFVPNLDQHLPEILADVNQIRQIVMNLVVNASEGIGDHSGSIQISTGVVQVDEQYLADAHQPADLPAGSYVQLEVADDGSGINPDQLSRIFDPFFTTKFTGRGLGLAAVLGIVRAHKGAIKVRSKPSVGTTIQVLFPCVESNVTRADRGGLTPAANANSSEGLVLVIDDEAVVREVVSRMVESFGYRVVVATNGREGVRVFRENQDEIAAVLLDLTMPEMDGKEAFAEIRKLCRTTKVMLMSGFNEKEACDHFDGQGLAGFLQKPFELEVLKKKLEQVLEMNRSESRNGECLELAGASAP